MIEALLATVSLKLWMHPIGGGFVGDRFGTLNVLGAALFCAALTFVALIVFPSFNQLVLLACVVIVIGLPTYAVRGPVLERARTLRCAGAYHGARDRDHLAAGLFARRVPAAVERLADDRVSRHARLSALFRLCRGRQRGGRRRVLVAEGYARTRSGPMKVIALATCVVAGG